MAARRSRQKLHTESSPHDVYRLTCACGEVLAGDRTDEPQHLKCPRCGELLYVLARDVYPRPQLLPPEPPPPAPSPGRPAAPESGDTYDLLQDTEFEEKPPRRPDPPRRVWIDRSSGRRIWKQILVVGGTAALLLGFVIWWGMYVRRLERAEETYAEQSQAAWDAAATFQWDEAFAASNEAVEAADLLGRDDPGVTRLRQLHRELTALDGLCTLSPIEIVLEKSADEYTAEEWTSHFKNFYAGQWVVLTAEIVRVPSGETTTYHVDYPLGLADPEETVALVWDQMPPGVEQLTFTKDRCRAVCAAQLQEVRFRNPDETSIWEIVLDAEASFLWTSAPILSSVGMLPPDEPYRSDVRDLIDQQASVLGLKGDSE